MPAVFTDQILMRISFGIAGLIFELVLFILLMVLDRGNRDKNVKFQILVITVFIGNVISILDNVFRVSGLFDTPQVFKILLRLVALIMNVFLTYYVYQYLKTYIKNEKAIGRTLGIINNIIVLGCIAYAVVMFVQAVVNISGGGSQEDISSVGRIIIGYIVELYFLSMSMFFVVKYRKSFDKRAFFTALGAYAVIIITIVIQFIQTRGILLNYFGAAIGTYIFYIGVEIPDHRNLKRSIDVVQTLAEAIDAKDNYTKGHSSRVALYSREIAKRAGYTERAQSDIYMMGLLHDVGKIGVPDSIIKKPGKLTDEEYEAIKKHPVVGAKILENIEDMPELSKGARWHHERFDGHGYPDGLSGGEIPEVARIIAVADAYDAMTSNRRYRDKMSQERVREEIEKGKGTQFDSRFADIMIQMINEDKDYTMREK